MCPTVHYFQEDVEKYLKTNFLYPNQRTLNGGILEQQQSVEVEDYQLYALPQQSFNQVLGVQTDQKMNKTDPSWYVTR